jgi:hypothetical protein
MVASDRSEAGQLRHDQIDSCLMLICAGTSRTSQLTSTRPTIDRPPVGRLIGVSLRQSSAIGQVRKTPQRLSASRAFPIRLGSAGSEIGWSARWARCAGIGRSSTISGTKPASPTCLRFGISHFGPVSLADYLTRLDFIVLDELG